MEKLRKKMTRFKAKVEKIFGSDDETARPSTPAPAPTNNLGGRATLSTEHVPTDLSPAPVSAEPRDTNNLVGTASNPTESGVAVVERAPAHTPWTHSETIVATLSSTPHPGESSPPAGERTAELPPLEPNHAHEAVEHVARSDNLEVPATSPSKSLSPELPTPANNQKVNSDIGLSSWVKSEGWPNLKRFLDTVSQAASIGGLGPVKTVVEGLASCIGIYEDAAQGRTEYDELRAQLEDIFDELSKYLSSSPAITASIANICGSIKKELEYVKTRQVRPMKRRLQEAEMDSDNVLACYRRIRDHLQRLSLNANMSIWGIVEGLATDHRLRKLESQLSECHNSAKATELGRGPCTKGTRLAVLAQMHEWATSRDSGSVYWMNGMAGTGKTTIAYSLCQQLDNEENRLLCASFFCSRSLPECRSVQRIIPSIAYQISQGSLPFRYALAKTMEESPADHTRSPDLQFESLIIKPLSDAKVKQAFPTNAVVVIDALDECDDIKSTQQILEVLLTKARGLPIKFLVSSRPESSIRYQMKKNGTWVDSRVVLHELDTGEVQTDIKTYLRERLSQMNPLESEIEKVAERAGVLFIYAATVVRYVGYDDFRRNPRVRLNSVLGMTNRRGNGETKEIDALYGAILEAAMNDNELEEPDKDDMKLILSTVVCAKAPLTVNALNGLLKLGDVGRVEAALQPLWSVLHVMGPKMTVTTLHASFPDYLTSAERSGKLPWHCDAKVHNCLLAQRCFEYMHNTRPQFNICNLESSYIDDNEVEDLEGRVEKAITVELRYACQYWSSHLNASDSGSGASLLASLEQFLSNSFLLWAEVMNLTKAISAGPADLASAKHWATQHDASTEVTGLIHDAWRFAFSIASSLISQSTPHIYVSMLPFLPSHSHIRKRYAHRMGGMIGVSGTALDRRKALFARWHVGACYCIACSPGGTLVAIVTRDSWSSISLVDASSRRAVRKLSHKDIRDISCIAFSPDGTRLASGGFDSYIWVWDVNNGQLVLGPLAGHQGSINQIAFSPRGSRIACGCTNGAIYALDAFTGDKMYASLVGHSDAVRSIAVTSDDTRIVSGSRDHTIRIWNMQTGHPALDPITGHTDWVVSVAISPNDQLIVSCSRDRTVRVWDSQTGQPLLGPFSFTLGVVLVAISPSGRHISAGLSNGTIHTWDATTGKAVFTPLQAHNTDITMLSYSADGTRILSYSPKDGHLCVSDSQSVTETLSSLPGHSGSINSIDVSPDGKQIASGSDDTTVCLWDPITGQPTCSPLTGHTGPITIVRYSECGNRILSCSWDKTLQQWDSRTGAMMRLDCPIVDSNVFIGFKAAVYSLDGSYIATICHDDGICIWDSSTGTTVNKLMKRAHGGAIAFSPDGTILFIDRDDWAVYTWNVQTGQVVCHATYRQSPFNILDFSPDKLHWAIASQDYGDHRVFYCSTTGAGAAFSDCHTKQINSIRFSSDGTRIVSGSKDMTVHVWDVKTGASIFGPLVGHTSPINSVAYSPDGQYVASASDDRSIRIWDVSTQPDLSPLSNWQLNKDGWVKDKMSQRLIWVPLDFRGPLLFPRNTMRMSHDGYLRLSFDGALIGEKWASCWTCG